MELTKDIDQQIEEHQALIAKLEAEKQDRLKKMEGIEAFQKTMSDIAQQYRVSERELLLPKQGMIAEWIIGMAKDEFPPQLYRDLESHFARRIKAGQKTRKAKKPASNEPKVPTGLYVNPETGKSVEKIKRSPRMLLDWINEYGVERVLTWHKPQG